MLIERHKLLACASVRFTSVKNYFSFAGFGLDEGGVEREKMNTKVVLILKISIMVLLIAGCKKDDSPSLSSARTVMVYMAANNSLNGDAYTNINQMERAFQGINGKLLVYARLKNTEPKIYEIQYDTGNDIRSRVLKCYGEHNSSDPEVMAGVIADMQQLAASRSYGLVLWSHATSWHPDPRIRLKSFGDDGGETMDIKALKTALPDNLDFLLFDACSMASVEVLYELRDKARYIIASPAEVISVGMPYDEMLHDLYDTDLKSGLITSAKAYYDHYNGLSDAYQSATVSVIDNAKLDKLAGTVGTFLSTEAQHWSVLKRDEVQRLDFAPDSPTAGFDLIDFYQQNFPDADIGAIEVALQDAVLYTAHTPNFNGQEIRAYSGLSMYIPHPDNAWVHPYYKGLDWYTASQAVYIFNWL